METSTDRPDGPTAASLLDVRTPAELTFSPDGSLVAPGAIRRPLGHATTRRLAFLSGRAWPDLQKVGRAVWRNERWRYDAFIGDAVATPACVITDAARHHLDRGWPASTTIVVAGCSPTSARSGCG